METSDSEYFESADEDFEPEKEVNKNKKLTHHNSLENLSKNINKLSTSDVKESKNEIELVKEDNKREEQNPISVVTNIKTEDRITEVSVSLAEDKNVTSDNIGQICLSNTQDKTQDDTDDNLWNEGDGWGVEDESDKEDCSSQSQKVTLLTKTSIETSTDDKSLDSNEKNISKVEEVGEKNMWESEEWDNWESINEENITSNNTKDAKEIAQGNSTKCDADNSNNNSSQLWNSWGNWGVSSILSTATQSVSTLTNSVSQGLSTVLETGIGAPDPEKLAMLNKTEENLLKSTEKGNNAYQEPENKNLLSFGFSNIGHLVSGVSKLVETTGTKVISGGLDTLETIGKKTMEVIQDGDPGLKRKRAFLNLEGEKPVLSMVLREAKEKAEEENKTRQEKHFTRKVNYESIFDDHQGLVHLEALEMLSKQCDMKLELLIESSSGNTLTEIQETLDQVKELCELPDEEDDEQLPIEDLKDKLTGAVEEIGIKITYDKLVSLWEETESWLNNLNLNICDENEIHEQAVQTLAQLTAIAVEQFHKAGELLLIKDHRSTADEADSLVQLTTTLTSLIGIVAAKFSDKMNSKATENSNKENINSLITNIFFEAANSSSYIQDAFQLLVPVLQMGAV